MNAVKANLYRGLICFLLIVTLSGCGPNELLPLPDEADVRKDVQAYITELLLPGAEIQEFEMLKSEQNGETLEAQCEAAYGKEDVVNRARFTLVYVLGETEWVFTECHVEMAEQEPVVLPAPVTEEDPEETPETPEPALTITLACGAQVALDAEKLDLRGYAVDDLAGLEQCTGLKELYIDGGQLEDISPLSGLANLEILYLNNVPVANLRPLTELPNLQLLNIKDTLADAEMVKYICSCFENDVQVIGYGFHRYFVSTYGCSWSEANEGAENLGGYLATVQSEEEFRELSALADASGMTYFWLGGTRTETGWSWVTGEEWTWENWYPGEPSGVDYDGAEENRLCMWKMNGAWSFNDQRDDLSALSSVINSLGYIVEIEEISGISQEKEQKENVILSPETYYGIWATTKDAPTDDIMGGVTSYHTYYLGVFDGNVAIRCGYRYLEVGSWSLNEYGELAITFSECFYNYPGDGWKPYEIVEVTAFSYDDGDGMLRMTDSTADGLSYLGSFYDVDWYEAYASCKNFLEAYWTAGSECWMTQFDLNMGSGTAAKLWNGLEQTLYTRLSATLTGTALEQLKSGETSWAADRFSLLEETRKEYEGGSICSLMVNSADIQSTTERVGYLMTLLPDAPQ